MSGLAGCAGQAPPGGTDPAPAQLSQGRQNCRDFTVPVTVGGQQQQAVGQACQLAGHAEYARLAGAGLHAAAAGDESLSVPGPIPILLGGPLVLWARVLW